MSLIVAETPLVTYGAPRARWPRVKLGDVTVRIGSGATPLGGHLAYKREGIPFIRSQNVLSGSFTNEGIAFIDATQAAELAASTVAPGDVLLNITGASIGRACVAPHSICPANVNQHVSVIRPGDSLDADFLAFFFLSPPMQKRIGNLQAGATRQALTKAQIEQFEIPLPPLAEQQRIAARLREQLAAAETARQAVAAQLAAARRLPSAILEATFAGSEADAWPRVRLGDVLLPRNDIVHPSDKPKGRAQFVGLEHVEPHTGRRLGAVEVEQAELTGRKARFFPGDIVYGYLRPYLNKVWIAEFAGLCSVDQYVYRIAPEQADTAFIAWFLRSPTYLRRAPVNVSPGQLPRIRMEEVAAVEIGLPPLAEQRTIAARLDAELAATAALRASLERRLQDLEKLPATLLREAFAP